MNTELDDLIAAAHHAGPEGMVFFAEETGRWYIATSEDCKLLLRMNRKADAFDGDQEDAPYPGGVYSHWCAACTADDGYATQEEAEAHQFATPKSNPYNA